MFRIIILHIYVEVCSPSLYIVLISTYFYFALWSFVLQKCLILMSLGYQFFKIYKSYINVYFLKLSFPTHCHLKS